MTIVIIIIIVMCGGVSKPSRSIKEIEHCSLFYYYYFLLW